MVVTPRAYTAIDVDTMAANHRNKNMIKQTAEREDSVDSSLSGSNSNLLPAYPLARALTMSDTIKFNVGGKVFEVAQATIHVLVDGAGDAEEAHSRFGNGLQLFLHHASF